MSAAPATVAAPPRKPDAIVAYADEGPLATTLGGAVARLVPLPGEVLALVGAIPVFAAIALEGGDASDGVVVGVLAWLVLCGALVAGRPRTGRLRWIVPPLWRATEYAALLWLAAADGAETLPAAFALLCALAFRHYDLVYRLRHRSTTPPAWVNLVSLGWDGRIALAAVLLLLGALPAGLWALAVLFAAVFVADSAVDWTRWAREQRGTMTGAYEDEEDEGQ